MGKTKKSEQNLGFIRREERKLMVFGLGTTDVCFEQGNCELWSSAKGTARKRFLKMYDGSQVNLSLRIFVCRVSY